jgi:hypothetical protein
MAEADVNVGQHAASAETHNLVDLQAKRSRFKRLAHAPRSLIVRED